MYNPAHTLNTCTSSRGYCPSPDDDEDLLDALSAASSAMSFSASRASGLEAGKQSEHRASILERSGSMSPKSYHCTTAGSEALAPSSRSRRSAGAGNGLAARRCRGSPWGGAGSPPPPARQSPAGPLPRPRARAPVLQPLPHLFLLVSAQCDHGVLLAHYHGVPRARAGLDHWLLDVNEAHCSQGCKREGSKASLARVRRLICLSISSSSTPSPKRWAESCLRTRPSPKKSDPPPA